MPEIIQNFADDFAAEMKLKRLLIADDYVAMRATLYRLLGRIGWEDIIQADSGATALDHLSRPGIGALLSDFRMAHFNGLQVLQEVRCGRTAAPRDLPVLLITGHADHELVRLARALDVNGIIVKPFNASALEGHLDNAFRHPIEAKPAAFYADIEVPAEEVDDEEAAKMPGPVRASLPHQPVKTILSSHDPQRPRPGTISIAAARPGMKVREALKSASGMVLIGPGATLTPHMLERLREMAPTHPELRFIKIEE